MKILFINHNSLESNSGIHIVNIANHLVRNGMECFVCVPCQKRTEKKMGNYLFEIVDSNDLRKNVNDWKIDIIHAWTPRECVRLITEEFSKIYQCPYIVHLEDNEEYLLEANLGRSISYLKSLSQAKLDKIIPPHLSHPIYYREFLEHARGITLIIEELCEFCPPGISREVIWPGYENEIEWTPKLNGLLRKQLGIEPNEYVVVYTGNSHSANQKEVFSLYLAIGLLNRVGIPTRIVRTGIDNSEIVSKNLNEVLNKYIINLGFVDRNTLPSILSLADVLVQPGKIDNFNNFRFPSKLPEFLASGKPVILPATNIGKYLKDGEECILLRQGHALEIAKKLELLFINNDLRARIGEAGRLFAAKNLNWVESTKKLLSFYQNLLN